MRQSALGALHLIGTTVPQQTAFLSIDALSRHKRGSVPQPVLTER
jgi:hypothetical protein